MIRNERGHPIYTTQFVSDLFEAEGGDLYEVRMSVLGHLQQGGDPSPLTASWQRACLPLHQLPGSRRR